MSFRGYGMLCVFTDVDSAIEVGFNRWYDKEHMEERVRVPGFGLSTRYVASSGGPRNLALYETASLGVFRSPDYRQRLANQTKLSRWMLSQMFNMHRTVGQIVASVGFGRGPALAVRWLCPTRGCEETLREYLLNDALRRCVAANDVLSAYVLRPDSELSGPLPENAPDPNATAGEQFWFVFVEGATMEAVSGACRDNLIPTVLQDRASTACINYGEYQLRSAFSSPIV